MLSQPQGHSAIARILCQRKIPMTQAGIEPATFRFVAQQSSGDILYMFIHNIWYVLCLLVDCLLAGLRQQTVN